MGNHQRRNVMFSNNIIGNRHYFSLVFRIKGCCMFIKQQQLWRDNVAISKVNAWRWPPESKPTSCFHPILSRGLMPLMFPIEEFLLLLRYLNDRVVHVHWRGVGKTEVSPHRHIGGRSFHRVLERDRPITLARFMSLLVKVISWPSIKMLPSSGLIRTGNHVQKRRFTSAAADDGHKITIIKMQIQMG